MTADEALRRAAAKGLVLERSDACESGFVGVTRRAAARGRKEFCAEVIPDVWFQTAEEAALAYAMEVKALGGAGALPPPAEPAAGAARTAAGAARTAPPPAPPRRGAARAAPRPRRPRRPRHSRRPTRRTSSLRARESPSCSVSLASPSSSREGSPSKSASTRAARATTRRARAAAPHAGRPAGVCTYSSILKHTAHNTNVKRKPPHGGDSGTTTVSLPGLVSESEATPAANSSRDSVPDLSVSHASKSWSARP